MPHTSPSYKAPFWYFNHHLETMLPSLTRKVSGVDFTRERIDTPDDDFLDLDWIESQNDKLVIISHGLEGNSTRPYMLGMSRIFSENQFDVIAWNYRGCSGEVNRQVRAYHSGATDDLQVVIDHAFSKGYKEINLIGFSLGGNITLKYIGEQGGNIDTRIKKAVAYSVPVHLYGSSIEISKLHNLPYSLRFLRNLKKKVKEKAKLMPDKFDSNGIDKIKTIMEFDDHFTAPVHGYKDALEYYASCSSIQFLDKITIPTLLVNAHNDSFLSKECYPDEIAKNHPYFFLETPLRGGHCGFPGADHQDYLWSENRAVEFILSSTV